MSDLLVAAACNSESILAANLARSPLLADVPLHCEWRAPSAAAAYNRALEATSAPIMVFAHQDVFLPLGWDALLQARIAEITALEPESRGTAAAVGIGLQHAALLFDRQLAVEGEDVIAFSRREKSLSPRRRGWPSAG